MNAEEMAAMSPTFIAYAEVLAKMYIKLTDGGVPQDAAVKVLCVFMHPPEQQRPPTVLPLRWRGGADA